VTLRITRRNSAFQVLQSIAANRQKRHQTRTFLVEGVRPITIALERGWTFGAVIYAGDRKLSSWARDVIARSPAATRYELSDGLLAELSGKQDTSEILAVLEMPEDGFERIPLPQSLLVVVADRPASPGNLGTLMRSCDAFGAQGLIVSGHAADTYDRATIAASRGSLFAISVVRTASPAAVATWIAERRRTVPGLRVVCADERGGIDVFDSDLSGPTVIVLGNEAQGLSRAYLELCDVAVRIPMTGAASSLNVGVAGSILLYEAARQRGRR
jgi:tRNA G18 (ribose-2'-O)-methylase SpoU